MVRHSAKDAVSLSLEDGQLLCWGCGVTALAKADALAGGTHEYEPAVKAPGHGCLGFIGDEVGR